MSKPPHKKRCIIFEKCLFKVDSRDVCTHPAIRQPGAVVKKHVKGGPCSDCARITVVVCGRYIILPESPVSVRSFSFEKTDDEEES